jgi:hypothetical protein
MDLLASILSAVLVCGVIGAGIAMAWRIGRAISLQLRRRRNRFTHRAHVLTGTMVHYRANIRMMKETLKPAG